MDARTVRIMREARPLLWPWVFVTSGGTLPWLVSISHYDEFSLFYRFLTFASVLGFWIGLPLLATLPLGNEFQHRTIGLLLSQPVDRLKIWAEKWSVTIIAVLSAALVYCLGWRAALDQDASLWGFATI